MEQVKESDGWILLALFHFPSTAIWLLGKTTTELFCLISSGAGLGQVDGSLWKGI